MSNAFLNSQSKDLIAPVISVVLPVYNGAQYLAEAIDSVLAQTFDNFELIVINDGSTDESLTILQNYQTIDARVRLISQENKGLVATLNEGVKQAKGEWIARMDQDDIALPQRFERQLKWLEQTDSDICGSWVQLFGTADKRILKHPETDSAIKVALLFGTVFAHPSVMMRKNLAEQLRYDGQFEKAEDYDLWERTTCAGWKMTNVPEVLLHYRFHAQQMSAASAIEQQRLTQIIRQRYWEFIAHAADIKPEWITEVIKMRESSISNIQINMNYVDLAFSNLLEKNHGEARAVIFDHLTRLYFRVAGNCPDIVARWSRLNKKFGTDTGFKIKFRLFILSVLKINSDSYLFNFLKKLYFYYSVRNHEKL